MEIIKQGTLLGYETLVLTLFMLNKTTQIRDLILDNLSPVHT